MIAGHHHVGGGPPELGHHVVVQWTEVVALVGVIDAIAIGPDEHEVTPTVFDGLHVGKVPEVARYLGIIEDRSVWQVVEAVARDGCRVSPDGWPAVGR
jgi:hypothetical protein